MTVNQILHTIVQQSLEVALKGVKAQNTPQIKIKDEPHRYDPGKDNDNLFHVHA